MLQLNSLIKLPFFKDIKLLFPVTISDSNYVTNISIQESPIENFVRHGEIILSTALIVREKKETLLQFIREIEAAGASALILSFPNDFYNTLNALLPELTQSNFPIFISPWNIAFADIVENTLKEIWNQDEKNRIHMESLQHDLLNCYLAGGTLFDAAKLISSFFQCKTVIADSSLLLKGTSDSITQQDFATFLLKPDTKYIRIDINTFDRFYGYVILYDIASTIDAATISQNIHEYSNNAISLWFAKESSITSTEIKSQEDFIWKLAHEGFSDSLKAISTARELNFNPDCNYICMIGSPVLKRELSHGIIDLSFQSKSQIQAASHILQEQLYYTAASMNLSIMATFQNQYLLIYLEDNKKTDTDTLFDNYVSLFESNIQSILPNWTFLWGYDHLSYDFGLLHRGFSNALDALNLCREILPSDYRLCYQSSLGKHMLSTLCSNREIMDASYSILSPLLEYDKTKNSSLVHTLKTYCDTNFNVSETARLEHLHRQSLLYRLEKIEVLTHLSLKNHEHIYLLDTCIQLYLCNKTHS